MRRKSLAVLVCFLASGASGLVYQIVWMRELTLVFGATTLAVSTVLAVFMGGLAAGSWFGGRLADRLERPLRAYGLVEVAIGLYGAAIPLLFALLPHVYQPLWRTASLSFFALSLVRFALAAAVLAAPTFLMGATLPILSRYVATRPEAVGRDVGGLYTINTLGAVVGAAVGGLVLIPALGLVGTTFVAAGLNLFAGALALWVARVETVPAPRKAAAKPNVRSERGTGERFDPRSARGVALLTAFGVSGLAALVYEVAWTRSLSLVLGSSVYAFAIMLTTFLVGLAVGAGIGARIADRVRRPLAALAGVEAAVGVAAFVGLFLIAELPYVFLVLYRGFEGSPTALLLVTRLLAAALVMLVPTILLGAVFPIAVRAAVGSVETVGRTVGQLYSVNTLGAIVGAFSTGFVLIPWLGVEGSIVAAVALNMHAAAGLALVSRGAPRPARIAVAAALVAAAGLAVPLKPDWDPAVMASGVYRYAPTIKAASRADFLRHYATKGDGETVFYRDGVSATVAVQMQHGHYVLKVNGKPDATTAGDLPTQALIAHLPLLVHPDPKTALVIGWGSGVTVGAALAHPLERVTAVELEPAVVDASHFFDEVNGRPLEDPRTELLLNDGRNVLVATDRRFDVIVSEPSNPWLSGVANLFTSEYFEAGAAHLAPGGLFCQWLQIYEMQPTEVATLMATFTQAFPHVYVFRGASGDLMLLGAREPFAIDAGRIEARLRGGGRIDESLARVGVRSAAALLSRLYLTPAGARAFGAGAPINTDDNARIVFLAPLRVGVAGESTEQANVDALLAYGERLGPHLTGGSPLLFEDMAIAAIARGDSRRAELFIAESLELGETARGRSILGELFAAAGHDEQALAEWQRALSLDPNDLATNLNLGKYYLGKNNLDGALAHLDRAVAAAPANARAHHLRSLVLQATGAGPDQVLAELVRARDLDPKYAEGQPAFALHYGRALRDVGRYDKALEPLTRYADQQPGDPIGHFELGLLHLIVGDQTLDAPAYRRAEESFLRALAVDPAFADAYRGLSLVYRKQGRIAEAEEAFEDYERYRKSWQ
jgi:spermidine synthase